MASHRPSTREVCKPGRVTMARGRVVCFSICRYARYRKRHRWLVWFHEQGKRYDGVRPLNSWFASEEAAVRAVRQRWPAVRGGFRYPVRRP